MKLQYATLGSISHGTLNPDHLLPVFISALEDCQTTNGAFLAMPENRQFRDSIANLIGEAQDCFSEGGETIDPAKEETAGFLLNEEIPDLLQMFAPPYACFGSHPGDGSDIGFWIDVDDVGRQLQDDGAFVSFASRADAQEAGEETDPDDSAYPPTDYRGEWLHVNDHGNCALYVRDDDGNDVEIWAIV